ncbi:MAG: ATP-binding protein [Lawsonibacter sp.]|jgi:predicted AAA+ superfamily ATPase
MNLNALRLALNGISAYRPILDTPLISLVRHFLNACNQSAGEEALDCYTRLFYTLRQEGFVSLGDWVFDYLRYTDSPYGTLCAQGEQDPALENAAHRDVDTLALLCTTDCDRYLETLQTLLPADYAPVLAGLPRWTAEAPFDFHSLTQFYHDYGCGKYARYHAFLWEEGQLIPVPDPDCPKPEDLLGYELQRGQVETNTRQLVQGKPANNVLLFGDGGTGKSATVKSMLYLPGMGDLRLIELQKENLTGLPSLMRSLGGRRQKFILFIDDLAFDQDDKTYSSLKTILEGSLEKRPSNVAIYATSNRRHLVRQNFSDRGNDEVDAAETISEKTALAERFGLRIPYLTMNKDGYLALVDYLAAQAGITLDKPALHAQAMTWEIRHSGRTPRVARQFIASLHQD